MSFGFGFGFPRRAAASGAAPSLNFDFTSLTSLPSRITFSRTSNATLTDSTGKIAYAPHNLLTNSEDFEAAAWTKSNGSITANAAVAPDGTTTADKFIPNNTSIAHAVQQSATTSSLVVFSVCAKAAEYNRLVLSSSANNYVYFNLTTGAVESSLGTGWTAADIVSVGNGWYRCWAATSVAQTRFDYLAFNASQTNGNTAPTFAGDGTSGLFIWGAQLNVGELQSYNSTTPKNLLGYTQEFDNAAWTKGNSSITANAIAAPDGYATADKLVENTANAEHLVLQSGLGTGNKTASIYFKAAERTKAYIYLYNATDGAVSSFFDLSAGTVLSGTGTITSVGGGWYRCSLSRTATASDGVYFGSCINSGSTSYTGDGTSGIFIWGAQLSNSASVDPYVYNPQAAPTSTAYYGPRFDYNPVTLAANGLLVEEQRSNLLTYSGDLSNAAWTLNNPGTRTGNTDVAPDGTTTAATITDNITGNFTSVRQTVTVANNSQQYTASVYIKKTTSASSYPGLGLTLSGGTIKYASLALNTTTGVATARTGETPDFITVTDVGTYWRVQWAITNNTTGNVSLIADVYAAVNTDASATWTATTTGSTVAWGAQLEAGSFATSYIPTVASQVTRAADNASMLGDNFSTWYNQTQGTFATTWNITASISSATAVEVSDASANNRFNIQPNTGGTTRHLGFVSGVAQIVVDIAGAATGVSKDAFAYALGDFAASRNASAVATSSYAGLPIGIKQMNIGNTIGANYINGTIRSINYYPTRLPNATLQAITA